MRRRARARRRARPNDPAMLMYTSGTTGQPKGALLSHANMLAAGRAVAASLALTPSDRVLSSLPLYHINGQCIATVAPLVSGGSIVMPHRFSVSQWWPLVARYRPTWLNIVPTIIAYLLNGPDPTPEQAAACRSVRFGRSASAPLPPEQHRAFEARFGISVIEAMGLTECASVAFSNPLDASRAQDTDRPECRSASRRASSTGRARRSAPDERGEIELRGDNVMLGYYKSPEATAAALRADGWLATGDLGYRDADGYLLHHRPPQGTDHQGRREHRAARDRRGAACASGGAGSGGRRRARSRPTARRSSPASSIKAGVSCTEDELRAHCVRTLGRYKAPRYLRLVGELPKGPSGKVQRLKLLEL